MTAYLSSEIIQIQIQVQIIQERWNSERSQFGCLWNSTDTPRRQTKQDLYTSIKGAKCLALCKIVCPKHWQSGQCAIQKKDKQLVFLSLSLLPLIPFLQFRCEGAFLVRENCVLKGPFGCSLPLFTHTAHSAHSLRSAPLRYTSFAQSLCSRAHSLCSLPRGTVEIHEYVFMR